MIVELPKRTSRIHRRSPVRPVATDEEMESAVTHAIGLLKEEGKPITRENIAGRIAAGLLPVKASYVMGYFSSKRCTRELKVSWGFAR